MSAADWGRFFVIWIVIAVVFSPWLGKQLAKLSRSYRARSEFRQLLERERQARISDWISREEAQYLRDITAKYEYERDYSVINAISDDAEAFHMDSPRIPDNAA